MANPTRIDGAADVLYEVVCVTKNTHGILRWKRFTFDKEVVARSFDLRGAIDFAIDFRMWANEAISVQGAGRTWFSKAGAGMRDW